MTISRSTISRSTISRTASRLLVAHALVLSSLGAVAATGAAPAQGAVSAGVSVSTANRALAYAASKRGAPYLWGAVGPSRFDCSGLTQWAYARAGKRIPRTTNQQYAATIRVARANARPGDLVFFMNGRRYTSHMGIYAGRGRMWHSPRAGQRVKLSVIWKSNVVFKRVR